MSKQAVHVLVFDGFADWEPAHALAELRDRVTFCRGGGVRRKACDIDGRAGGLRRKLAMYALEVESDIPGRSLGRQLSRTDLNHVLRICRRKCP